jgi:hypothetical protein
MSSVEAANLFSKPGRLAVVGDAEVLDQTEQLLLHSADCPDCQVLI